MLTGLLIYFTVLGTIFIINNCIISAFDIAYYIKLFNKKEEEEENSDDKIPDEVLHLYV